jgi:hypothetical protein
MLLHITPKSHQDPDKGRFSLNDGQNSPDLHLSQQGRVSLPLQSLHALCLDPLKDAGGGRLGGTHALSWPSPVLLHCGSWPSREEDKTASTQKYLMVMR